MVNSLPTVIIHILLINGMDQHVCPNHIIQMTQTIQDMILICDMVAYLSMVLSIHVSLLPRFQIIAIMAWIEALRQLCLLHLPIGSPWLPEPIILVANIPPSIYQ